MDGDNYNDEEEEGGLTELEQLRMDDIVLGVAYNNAWLVLSNQLTFDQLIDKQFKEGQQLILPFDPESGPKQCELENMISYYIETEEYEKCGKLTKILNSSYPSTVLEKIL
jgi:hypothetical protein